MKLWPSRSKATKEMEPVCDLDEIVAEPVPFRFNGKIHVLKPMELEEFLKFTNAQARLMSALKDDEVKLTPDKLIERYHAVIGAVCDTISVADIRSMEQAQIAALYQLVIDMVTGQVDGDGTGKKKRFKIPIYEYAQASSLPPVPANLDGPPKKH